MKRLTAAWVKKAEADYVRVVKLRRVPPQDHDGVCFHSQQVVEKYVKALLVLLAISFPRTHNIRALMALVPARSRPHLAEDLQDRLTEYAGGTRYPDLALDIPLKEARKALATARRIRREVRQVLPKVVLSRKKK
jgi:HEPN domain-containing protein